MTRDELDIKLGELDIPATDDDGLPIHIPPDERLQKQHGMDASYYRMDHGMEGLTTHPDSRICSPEDSKIQAVLKNIDVPYRLFRSAIELFSTSVAEYFDRDAKPNNLKYYPAVVLTFWSGFETLVRFSIEKFANTVPDVPVPVLNFLLETEHEVDKSGQIKERSHYHPVLNRYAVFLKYAYDLTIDQGSKIWQDLAKARKLRDYYTHLNVKDAKSIKSSEVLWFMEAVLLALIGPSCSMRKTIYLPQYELYFLWKVLYDISLACPDFVEEPFAKAFGEDWLQFHCNFKRVDSKKYPNDKEQMERLGLRQ